MEVDPPSPVPEDSSFLYVVNHSRPEASAWIAKEGVAYWESLPDSNKLEFLSARAIDIVTFSRIFIREPWLADFLSDAIAFYEIHRTWETYVCPNIDCSRLFKDDESLIIHLKCDHFSDIHPVAWPPRGHNLAEERRCADALRKMVWKPIVVGDALDLLSTMFLDHEHVTMADVCAGSDRLNSLEWLYSEDLERKRGLLQLEEGFQVLLGKQEQPSFSLTSDGFFTKMTALATEHIFLDHVPRFNLSFLQRILAHSPLSFCMLEARHLSRFVQLVKEMSQLVKQPTLNIANQEFDFAETDFSWIKSDILDALSVSLGENLSFSFQPGSLSYGGKESIFSFLCSAPPIPSIKRVPNKASVIFSRVQNILEHLKEGCTVTRLTHQIRSFWLGLDCLQPWCSKCQLKYQIRGPLNVPWSSLLSLMGVKFDLDSTSHLTWGPCSFIKVPDRLIESHFKSELCHLELVNELQCLESQLRSLCAVDCRKIVLLVMGCFLRMRLYFSLRWRRLNMEGKNPFERCPMISHQEENAEQKISNDESKSEYGSDYDTDESYFNTERGHYESESGENSDTESEPESESELDDKPWGQDPTFCRLHSTLSERATGKTADTGPFFWMSVSNILRQCVKDRNPVGRKSVLEGIRRFRLNKTWKYWLCYSCDETFIDRESHMVHLEDKHQLCLAHDDYWLIPKQDSRDEVENLRQDEVESELGLEDSITLDHTYRYFLVDSTNFYRIPSANEKEKLRQAKRKECMEIVGGVHSKLCDLSSLFHTKCKDLAYLEVVNALVPVLFNGDQPLSLLMIWLRKLSTMDSRTGTTHQLQFRFLSQLLCQACDQGNGPLSNSSVQNAFQNTRDDLISKIDWQDEKILEALVRIDDLKRNLSNLCVYDYRTEIVPSVILTCMQSQSTKSGFDDSLRSLGCNNIKELLSSLDKDYIRGNPPLSFSARVLSPGKLVINTSRKKPCWGLAFIGICLDFDGEWPAQTQTRLRSKHNEGQEKCPGPVLGVLSLLGRMLKYLVLQSTGHKLKITGIFNYGGLFSWPPGTYRGYGRVINCICEPHPSMDSFGVDVDNRLCEAVGHKFYSLHDEYFKQNR